jgi:hypothetical protein
MKSTKAKTVIEKFFKDSKGNVVVIQKPNVTLLVSLLAMVFAKIFSSGQTHTIFSLVSFGALFVWAILEIFDGTNYFRRLLGLVVLFAMLYTRLS